MYSRNAVKETSTLSTSKASHQLDNVILGLAGTAATRKTTTKIS